MEVIRYKEDGYLPGIILDKENRTFEMSGRACPEDPVEFYQPVFDWLDEYADDPLDEMVFNFKMTYYNTASSKVLMMIMQRLEEISDAGNTVKVRWHYPEDDEDMLEAGEDYDEMIDIEFEMVPYEED